MSDELTSEKFPEFFAEIISTRNLLGYAVQTIRKSVFLETTKDPILTLASIGVEKLYKLTAGVIYTRDHGDWPSSKSMKKFGHNINRLHEHVYQDLFIQVAHSTEFVREKVHKTACDPVVREFLNVLDIYGRKGRFYYLDHLGGYKQEQDPEEAWGKLETQALADPEVKRVASDAYETRSYTSEKGEKVVDELNNRIAKAFEDIWNTIVICGRNELLGPSNVRFAEEVAPEAVGRQ